MLLLLLLLILLLLILRRWCRYCGLSWPASLPRWLVGGPVVGAVRIEKQQNNNNLHDDDDAELLELPLPMNPAMLTIAHRC